MGCAVPLAMGFRLTAPERSVVAFVGDAGLEMILGELTTLWDLKLPLVIVVFVDKLLALIELKQRKSGLPSLGVDFGATNFPAVAEALGGRAVGFPAGTNCATPWMEFSSVKLSHYWLAGLGKNLTMTAFEGSRMPRHSRNLKRRDPG